MNMKDISGAVMGKPEIYFANMGHGEAIAFELNGQWYLRDFGEYSHRKNILTSCHVETVLDRKCADCVFSNFSNATGRAGKKINVGLQYFHILIEIIFRGSKDFMKG